MNKHVKHYIDKYKYGEIILNEERKLLIEHLELNILYREDLHFDDEMIEKCIKFIEKYYFELKLYQKFLIAFLFLYDEEGDVYYDQFLWLMARGAGKNGLISALSNFFTSELHGIDHYDGVVVATSEEQAKTSFEEMYNAIEKDDVLKKHYHLTKMKITSKKNKSVFKFGTSNAKTKDGGREGFVIYDEIHEYTDSKLRDVLSGGLGKVKHSREFFITTNGFVREGYLDKMIERSMAILKNQSEDDRLFPWICKIDHPDEIHDESCWSKANPTLEAPLSDYGKTLLKKIRAQYNNLKFEPSGRENFMTKRMNWPEVDLAKVIASYEDIMATSREIPILKNKTAIGGVDYASIRDFAAVGLLFKQGEDVVWITHSFARKEYLEKANLKPPIHEWEKRGDITIVDEPSINPVHIVGWFIEMRKKYAIQKVIADNFRMDLLRPLFEEAGFEIEVIRNPRAIHSLLAPRVETLFSNRRVIYGDVPIMRWYTNNIAVKIDKQGNKTFEKKDEHRRKTDGFQAFVHALYRVDEIQEIDLDKAFDLLDQLDF